MNLRALASKVRHTPLHPQWLLGRRKLPHGVSTATGRLLDIGAADRWVEPLLPDSLEYVALDYPPTGQLLYGALPDVFGDAACLPWRNECFDVVLCLEVLEHVLDPSRVLAELARVLRPGGRAWISMPFLYPLHDAPFDFQRFTEFGLRRDMQRAGLQVVSMRKSGHALRAAGLLMCLAIAGGLYSRPGWLKWLLAPVASVGVMAVNLSSWIASLVWMDWENMAMGYQIEVIKP